MTDAYIHNRNSIPICVHAGSLGVFMIYNSEPLLISGIAAEPYPGNSMIDFTHGVRDYSVLATALLLIGAYGHYSDRDIYDLRRYGLIATAQPALSQRVRDRALRRIARNPFPKPSRWRKAWRVLMALIGKTEVKS